jgi:hypothetical protein
MLLQEGGFISRGAGGRPAGEEGAGHFQMPNLQLREFLVDYSTVEDCVCMLGVQVSK